MTAPGQEPDEVTTGKPDEEEGTDDSPDLDAIGDHHMPKDLRRSQAERSAREAEAAAASDSGAAKPD